MTTIETISILITTYNRSHCLNELLHRLNTMFSVELKAGTTEILVFNDASTDNTETICVNYQDRIRYFSTPHNVGLIEARRRLIDAANGEYLVSLDDDSCFVDLDALDTIREAFEQYPTCAVLAANVAVPKTPGGQAPLDYVPFKAPGFIGCGHVLRSSAVKDIGSYPQFLKGYGAEETILTLRLFEGGYDVIFLPHLRVYHGEDWSNRPIIQERASKFS
ncbi:MAG: glycosyltransferase family 2 protein, partial [Chloroflexota bacterium]